MRKRVNRLTLNGTAKAPLYATPSTCKKLSGSGNSGNSGSG